MSRRIGLGGFMKGFLGFAIGVQLLCMTGMASGADAKPSLFSLLGSDAKPMAAIDFELKDLNGSLFRLSKFKGDKPVLVYFWATWCPYCLAVKPEIARLREKMGPSELEILAINVGGGDSLARLKRYQEGHPVSWPVLYDETGSVTRSYHVQGIPLFVLVDKEGNVIYRDNMLPPDLMKLLK